MELLGSESKLIMGATHYLDMMIREATISHDLHSRLLTAVHFQIKAGHTLGVTWPDWKGTPGEFGLLFRAFGEPPALQAFHEMIQPLLKANLIRAFPMSSVPDTDARVLFARDRKLDKFSPSSEARRISRAGDRQTLSTEQKPVRPSKRPHFLPMLSHTTSRSFLIYITKHSSTSDRPGGREYGLGKSLPDF